MPGIGELIEREQAEYHRSAMEQLRQDAEDCLIKKYGEHVSASIRARLEQELMDIDRAGAAGEIQILQEIRNILPAQEHPMYLAGDWNNFFLLFLLSITDIDPLPKTLSAHGQDLLFIPGQFSLRNADIRISTDAHTRVLEHLGKTHGTVLVQRRIESRCIDDTELARDIAREYLNTCPEDERAALEKSYSFNRMLLHLGAERLSEAPRHTLHLLPQMSGLPIKASVPLWELNIDSHLTDEPHINLFYSDMAKALELCQKKTGIPRQTIPLDACTAFQAICACRANKESTAVNVACHLAGFGAADEFAAYGTALDVHDFDSFLRVINIIHSTGAWNGNQKELLQDGKISAAQVITCREDVYRHMLRRGACESEAAEFMTYVRKGMANRRGFTDSQKEILAL